MTKKALTPRNIFISMRVAKQAVEEYIFSHGESFKIVINDVKKKWIIVC